MARILLSQSQVTVVLSSGIFFICILLLFVIGIVQQQRTVAGLKEAVKPRIPKAPPPLAVQSLREQQPELQASRLFGSRRDGAGHVAVADYDKAKQNLDANIVDWRRLAHVQIARNHHDVCNAIMVLAELHRMKSPARRILLFPQVWAADKSDRSDPWVDASRRLIKRAAKRFGVELRPITPVIFGDGEEGAGDVYSIASAYELKELDRVLMIETPGLLMDASKMDAILAFTEVAPFAMLHDQTEGDGVHAEDLFLLQPSVQVHANLTELISSRADFNDTQLSDLFLDPLLLESSSDSSALIRSVGTLHDIAPGTLDSASAFNGTAFLSDLAYLRFSDPKLPGPEYDVPWSQKRDARPQNRDADWVWTKLYGEFAQKRVDICGLDLETWRP